MPENKTSQLLKKCWPDTPVVTRGLIHKSQKIWEVIKTILHNTTSLQEACTQQFTQAIIEHMNITGQLTNRLLSWQENITQLRKDRASLYADFQRNTSIMEKLHAINKGLRPGAWVETIVDAILYIERSIKDWFPGVSMHIVLTPIQDVSGSQKENPLAQMLADEIEMTNKRFSDPDFTETPKESEQKAKLNRLISLLPLSRWALQKDVPPDELLSLQDGNIFEKNMSQDCQYLTTENVSELDPTLFGKIWSALVLNIPKIGKFLLSSEDPRHFNPAHDTLLVRNATEILWMSLAFIGEKEHNIKDPLTSLPLRRSFTEKAQVIFEEAQKNKTPVSFAIIDADHFKRVNDTYGHPTGDLVLKTLAKILRLKIKPADIAVRWGGEEFWVLMQTNADEAGRAIERAFDAIKKIHFQVDSKGVPSIANAHKGSHSLSTPHDSHTFSITLSAGIACNKDLHNDTPPSELTLDNLITEADKRLYVAKQTGRDKVVSK